MIRVDVQEYCGSCCDFEPEVTSPRRFFKDNGDEVTVGDTIIRCTYARRCEAIKRYLIRQDATYNAKE